MRNMGVALVLSACALIGGCSKSEQPFEGEEPPSVEDYKDVLERRVKSSSGADINIEQELTKYKNSSDINKKELYELQLTLLNR